MSVAAALLVKNEQDIIEPIVRHLLANVDEVIVADNLSSDGTFDLLSALDAEYDRLIVRTDEERGYYQSKKVTALAMEALERGHRWLLPVDADELWLTPDGRPIRDWLDGLGREVQFVKAAIYNHVCTALDPAASCGHNWIEDMPVLDSWPEKHFRRCDRCLLVEAQYRGDEVSPWKTSQPGTVEPNPIKRIRWRQRAHLDMRWGKVACRLRPDLVIHQGNHSASTHGTGTTAYGLEIRHFPYRSAEHFTQKAKAGYAAYQATDLDESVGLHWRVYGKVIEEGGDEAGHAWFYEHFFAPDPERDDSLVYDPAPSA